MKRIAFSISDNNNLKHYENLKKSWDKFCPDVELRLYGEKEVAQFNDPAFYYRATPLIAQQLQNEGYRHILKLDSDQLILGDISDIWKVECDVATVLNDPTYPINLWDIAPYFNNGTVLLKNNIFIDHWARLCMSRHFNNYQFREQDLLNILCSDYFTYKVKCLDLIHNDNRIYGEWAKPFLTSSYLNDGKVMFKSPLGDKQLMIWHSGGGSTADKGNYRTKFPESVVDYIDSIVN